MGIGELKIKQLQHQSETWKRDLGFITQENVALKNRLAEILSDGKVTLEFLQKVEAYQNDFIAKDETIRLIRDEIRNWDSLLKKDQYLDGNVVHKKLLAIQKKLSRGIETFTREFNELKFDFNNYMSEIL
jgi:hypothetical protein